LKLCQGLLHEVPLRLNAPQGCGDVEPQDVQEVEQGSLTF